MTAVNVKGRRADKSKLEVTADSLLLQRLLDTTPSDAEQWVTDNITSVTDARDLLAKLTKVVVYLLQKSED